MVSPILFAILLFLLAIIVAIGVGFIILRELRQEVKVSKPPATTSPLIKYTTAPSTPVTQVQGSLFPQPEPVDNAKLYRQAPLSPAESAFHDFLSGTVNGQYLIGIKTPLTDLFKRYGWLQKELYTMHSRGHVDFVLLDPKFKTPVLAIELDDRTHDTPKRQDADRRKEELFRRADMKLLRFRKGIVWGDAEKRQIKDALPKSTH